MVKYSRYQANFSFIYLKNNLNFILKVLRNKNNQNISKHITILWSNFYYFLLLTDLDAVFNGLYWSL